MERGRTKDRRRGSGAVKSERRKRERRSERRFPLDLWVEAEKEEALYFQRVGNLSAGGCFFLQTVPHPVGTHVKLRFHLPDRPDEEIHCEGDIVSAQGNALGMGVKFRGLPEAIKERIRKLPQPS